MRILVKIPTRSRGSKIVSFVKDLIDKTEELDRVQILISCDVDDPTMGAGVVTDLVALGPVKVVKGESKSKIHACNRDIELADPWDIVVLVSDDMIPTAKGWDNVVRYQMTKHYPDTDGALWFHDGHQNRICTLSILGRKYFDRFGYLYHPDYVSLWCDNEFTEVAMRAGKMVFSSIVLFYHAHPMWTGERSKMDPLYQHNETFYHADKAVFDRRKAQNFPR